MGKVEKKFFSTILDNLIEYKTPVLSQLGNTLKKGSKKLRKYYTNHLGKIEWINLPKKIEKIMVKLIGKIDKHNDFFCFDTVDMNKNSAKKMEGLKIVRDGSRGTFGSGYVWYGVNINDKKNILKYLKRWEIDRIFKTLKQEYNFEKIGTMMIQKTDNLVALIQLSFGISSYIFNELENKKLKIENKSESISCEKILKKIKPFLKKKDLTLNRNSITNFLGYL